MNERIQELLNQSTSLCMGIKHVNQKMFAELIVRECASVAAKNQAEDMSWDISQIIKEHFGVEE